MAVNKVSYYGDTLIDLSNDTFTNANQLAKGVTGHTANGEIVTGTLEASGDDSHSSIYAIYNGDGTQTIYVTEEDSSVIDKMLYSVIAQRACNIGGSGYEMYTQADRALLRSIDGNVPLKIYDAQTGGPDRFNISCPSYDGNNVRVRIALYTKNDDGSYSRNAEPTGYWQVINSNGGFDFLIGSNEYIAVNIMIVDPETETSITITESIASWLHDNVVIERG